jgi:hypothetical protein
MAWQVTIGNYDRCHGVVVRLPHTCSCQWSVHKEQNGEGRSLTFSSSSCSDGSAPIATLRQWQSKARSVSKLCERRGQGSNYTSQELQSSAGVLLLPHLNSRVLWLLSARRCSKCGSAIAELHMHRHMHASAPPNAQARNNSHDGQVCIEGKARARGGQRRLRVNGVHSHNLLNTLATPLIGAAQLSIANTHTRRREGAHTSPNRRERRLEKAHGSCL